VAEKEMPLSEEIMLCQPKLARCLVDYRFKNAYFTGTNSSDNSSKSARGRLT
jgi:hypothetical protein